MIYGFVHKLKKLKHTGLNDYDNIKINKTNKIILFPTFV